MKNVAQIVSLLEVEPTYTRWAIKIGADLFLFVTFRKPSYFYAVFTLGFKYGWQLRSEDQKYYSRMLSKKIFTDVS